MAATGKVLGTVTSVVGEAKATAADGTVRILQVGDLVYADEVITTAAAGSINIALDNGKTLDCGGDTDLTLNESILAIGAAPSTQAPTGDVAALQAAIAAGADPTKIAEATAAGGAPAAGGALDGGSHPPVVLEQANAASVVSAGFATHGASIGFVTPEFQLLPIALPHVSVAVQAQVQVGVEENTGAGTVPPGALTAGIAPGAVALIEGTDHGADRLVNFVISLDKAFASDVQVSYQIVPGPGDAAHAAQPGSDYSGTLSATATIPAGQTQITVPVQIVQDHVIENNENFSIVLTGATNATIDPNANTAVVTIVDDDLLAVSDANAVKEDTVLTATGNVVANDLDTGSDSTGLAVSAVNDSAANVGHAIAGTYGSLTLNADGSYTYALNSASPAVQALAEGQQVTDTFSYTAVNGFDNTSPATLAITIFGTNDAPAIQVSSGQDQGGVQEDVKLGATGQLTSTDVDTGATASWSVHGSNSSEFGTFAVDQTGKWSYTLNNGVNGVDNPVQDLAAGQTVTEHYTVRVTDDQGATADQVVAISISGTNDVPTITGGAGAVQEDGQQTASGTLRLADIDTLDVNALKVTSADGHDTIQSIAEGATATVTVQGTYGLLTLDQAGNWVYTLNNGAANVQALAEGQQVTDVFPVAYVDNVAQGTNSIVITITGTDDAPTVSGSVATVSEEALSSGNHDLVPDSDSATDVTRVSGNISISDVDSNAFTVTLVAPPPNAFTSGGQNVTWAGDGTGHLVGMAGETQVMDVTIDNSGHYTVTLLGPVDQAAGSGENLFSYSFGVNVSDGILTTPTTLAVNVEDDTPVAHPDSNSVTANGPLAAGGNVLANDAIGADAHATVAWTGNTTAQYGTLALDGQGNYSYTLDPENPVVQALGHGQHVTETFDYTMFDADGDASPSTLTVTINGANQPPVITSGTQSGALAEDVGANESNNLTTAGAVTFSDVDLGDTHTTSFVLKSFDSTSAAYASPVGNFSLGSFTDTGLTTGTGGSQAWNFSVNDDTVDHLAVGEQIIQVYTVTVDDGNGGTATQDVSITIAGTNEAPTITSDVQSGAVVEDQPSDHVDLIATGAVTFSDVDLSDTHTTSVTPHDEGYVGALTLGALTDTSHSTGLGGSQGWTFTVADDAVDYLAAGQTLTQVYTVTVEDNHGGSATQDVAITITGTNEAPVVTSGSATTVSEEVLPAGNADAGGADDDASNDVLVAHGSFGITDVDNNAWTVTLSSQGIPALTSGGQAIVWTGDNSSALVGHAGSAEGATIITIALDNSGSVAGTNGSGTANYTVTLSGPLDHLAGAGENLATFDITADVNDNSGGTTPTSFAVNVEDDTPVAANDGNLTTVSESAAGVQIGTVAGLLANDSYGADGPAASGAITIATGSLGGMVAIVGGNLLYTSNTNVASDTTETFNYTIKDGDGDTATASFSVTVTDTGVTMGAAPANLVADEDSLVPNNPEQFSQTLSGHIAYTLGKDTIGSVVLSTGATGLQTLGGTTVQTVWSDTTKTLTGYAGTQSNVVFTITVSNVGNTGADYTMALLQPVKQTAAGEDSTTPFTVTATVTDADGSTGITNFTVSIIDDTPVAVNDGNLTTVSESAVNVQIGTVSGLLANDHYGADGPAASGAITIATGSLGGTVTIDNNGNLLYTSKANVASDTTETFNYTIKDGDGDTARATFSVTVTDTGVTMGAAPANLVADEDSLVGDPVSPSTVLSGHIAYSLGKDAISSVVLSSGATGLTTLNGTAVDTTWSGGKLIGYVHGDVTNQVFTITVSNMTNTGADYTMALLQPVKQAAAGEDSTTPFTVTATVTDADGSTGTTNFTVSIIDDTPVADVYNGIVHDVSDVTFTAPLVNIGADLSGSTIKLSGTPPQGLTSLGVAVTYDTSVPGALTAKAGSNTVFTITTDTAHGTYTFNGSLPIDLTVTNQLNSSSLGGSPQPAYYIHPDGSISTIATDVAITLTGTDSGGAANIKPSTDGIGIHNDLIDPGDTMKFDFDNLGSSGGADLFFGVKIGLAEFTQGVDKVTFSAQLVTQTGTPVDTVTHEFSAAGDSFSDGHATSTLTFDAQTSTYIVSVFVSAADVRNGVVLDYLTLQDTGTSTSAHFKAASLETFSTTEGPPQTLPFSFAATDGDGDSVNGSFGITFGASSTVTGTPAGEALAGGSGNEILVGGQGDDIMTGGGGSDTFKWGGSDLTGAAKGDTVTDFHYGLVGTDGNADVLNIHDLLTGAHNATTDTQLAGFVALQDNGTNTTVLVDPAGHGNYQPLVTLAGVTGHTLQDLLNNHQIQS